MNAVMAAVVEHSHKSRLNVLLTVGLSYVRFVRGVGFSSYYTSVDHYFCTSFVNLCFDYKDK